MYLNADMAQKYETISDKVKKNVNSASKSLIFHKVLQQLTPLPCTFNIIFLFLFREKEK